MSEYWKSTPKYWCKQCSVYVKDTPFERKQHENTGKHQGNLKRFLRGIQNDHERNEREKEKAKAEVDRLNRVVGSEAVVATTTATASAASSSRQNTASRKSAATAPSAADQQRQWAQLAEMGIQVPDSFKAEMAMPGEWQTVSKKSEELSTEGALSKGVRKRRLEDQADNDEEERLGDVTARRGWGSAVRRYPGQDTSGLDELLSEPLSTKNQTVKFEPQTKSEVSDSLKAEVDTQPLKIEEQSSLSYIGPEDKAISDVKTDTAASIVKNEDKNEQKPPLDGASGAITAPVFKKRKAKSQASPAENRAVG